MCEFLQLKPVCSHVVDCFGYSLNWLAAKNGEIKKWIFPLSVAGTVHANVKKPCLKFGRHGKIAEEAIHSHSWMKEHGDISSCDYWMFPILHANHYSMFIMNIKDKRYQFFDSRSTAGFKEQWLITGARIIKHVTEYLIMHNKDMDYTGFEWEMLDGIRQKHGSTDCGDYVM
ncbi:hypothetical protein LINPERHAP1_LOCUS31537, partial [Linum perenne]